MKTVELLICRKGETEKILSKNLRLYYVLHGETTVNRIALSDGEMLAVNPNEEHEYICQNGICTIFEISWSRVMQLMGYQRRVIVCNTHLNQNENARKLRRAADRLLRSLSEEMPNRLLQEKYSLELIFQLITDYSNNIFHENVDTRKMEIEAYIEANYANEITLDGIADEFGLTPQYFSKYFKETFGKTFLKYLNHVRLSYAADDLLYTDQTSLRIAVNNGFPNTASLIREFRLEYGMTPAEYRKENRKESKKKARLLLSELEPEIELKEEDVIVAELYADDIHDELVPYWTEILNVDTISSLMKNGVKEQISQLHDSLKFHKARIVLDTYSQNGKHLFYAADTAVEFLAAMKMDMIMVIDFRFVENAEQYLLYLKEQCRRLSNRFGYSVTGHTVFEIFYSTSFDEEKIYKYKSFLKGVKEILHECRFNDDVIGPAVLVEEDGENFRRFVKEVPEISTYTISSAPYTFQLKGEEVFINRLTDSDYVLEQYRTAMRILHEEGREDAGLLLVSWKDRLNDADVLNETPYMGCRIIKNVLSGYGTLTALPLDKPLDLMFDEMIYEQEFNMLPGVLTARGIRKPSYHALQFLDQQDEELVTVRDNLLITKSKEKGYYQILCHNGKKLSYRYYSLNHTADVHLYGPDLFENNEPLNFELRFNDLPEGKYLLKSRAICDEGGFAFGRYLEMKYPHDSFIGKGEIAYLKASSVVPVEGDAFEVKKDGRLVLKLTLKANEIRHLHLIKSEY